MKYLPLLLMFTTFMSFGQKQFKPAYIIEKDNDTLYGKIDFTNLQKLSKKILFRSKNNELKSYSPTDIIGFRFQENGQYFITKTIDHEIVFLEFLIKGELNVYYLYDGKDRYFIQKKNDTIRELPFEKITKIKDGKEYSKNSTKHIGILSYYTSDVAHTQKEAVKIKKPTHKNLIKFAEYYHNYKCDDQKCIVYTKKKNNFNVKIETVGGSVNLKNIEKLDTQNTIHYGVLVHLNSSKINENIFLRTGILNYNFDYYIKYKYIPGGESHTYSSFKIPIHIEYIYPKGIFRPFVSYGFNFYTKYTTSTGLNSTVSPNLGTYIYFNDKWAISLAAEFEFSSQIIMLPKELDNNQFRFGLLYDFK